MASTLSLLSGPPQGGLTVTWHTREHPLSRETSEKHTKEERRNRKKSAASVETRLKIVAEAHVKVAARDP